MRKIGVFFSGFLPFLTTFVAQGLATVFMLGIAAFFLFFAAKQPGFDFSTLQDLLLNTEFNACIMLIYSITCIVLMGLWYYRSCGGNFLPSPSRTFHPLQILAVVILVPGMQFFSGYLTTGVALIFPDWMDQYENLMETAGLSTQVGFFMFCYAVLLGPLCEELVFRGVTLRRFRLVLPFWAANVLQALLFGIFHMNWIQGIYAFVLGLLLGFLCEKGGSIYVSLLFHILFNFWGTVVGSLLSTLPDTAAVEIAMLFITLLSLGIGFRLFSIGGRKKQKRCAASTASPSHADHSGESE